jgi:hypothetical protein
MHSIFIMDKVLIVGDFDRVSSNNNQTDCLYPS